MQWTHTPCVTLGTLKLVEEHTYPSPLGEAIGSWDFSETVLHLLHTLCKLCEHSLVICRLLKCFAWSWCPLDFIRTLESVRVFTKVPMWLLYLRSSKVCPQWSYPKISGHSNFVSPSLLYIQMKFCPASWCFFSCLTEYYQLHITQLKSPVFYEVFSLRLFILSVHKYIVISMYVPGIALVTAGEVDNQTHLTSTLMELEI